jgi:hypothetical protein
MPILLSKVQVLAIFQARRPEWTAVRLSKLFGVNEKTIHDIWRGCTWSRETWHLDTSRPLKCKQTAGRPKGSKDTKPKAKEGDYK